LPRALEKINLGEISKKMRNSFSLLTLHRPANVDKLESLNLILNSLSKIPDLLIWPVHPRLVHQLKQLNIPKNIVIIEPLSYLEMLVALNKCNRVITDSGGYKKKHIG